MKNLFKNLFKKTPKNFQIGEVYKMKVASRSHVNSPYYIIIQDVGKDYITTNIPGYHMLHIPYPSATWDYQIPRMKYIGNNDKSKNLVHNQKIYAVH